ncbi:MAG: four helix bundle protein [Candidatus Marinimicrobia bacterium]|nr:four helix bundle protein [Candidatus Neomarinimicrobiota bacterium]
MGSGSNDLVIYKRAFVLAMEIFNTTKKFPKEKLYSLTSQFRDSSMSVCSPDPIGAEAYRKRQYDAHFISKTSDADMENSETQFWLDFAIACKYVSRGTYDDLTKRSKWAGQL